MSVDPVLVVYGVVVARAAWDRYGARIASEYDVLQRRLRRFSRRVARAANGAVAKAAGARDVESALRDLGDVNAALARLATALGLGTDGGRARFRAALSYDEGKCPRWAPTFARKALAECGVDFEAVGVDRATDAREGGSGGRWRRAAYGYVAEPRRRGEDGTSGEGEIVADEGGVDGENGETSDEDGFEIVHVIRRATFEEFYGSLKPTIQQLAIDLDAERRAANRAATASSSDGVDAAGEGEDAECSICMDNKLQVVVNCGHAFCDECHARWLRVSMTCPICREVLPRELDDESDASFALVDFDDVRDAVALAARANRRLLADIADDWRVETRDVAPTEDEIDDDLRRRASRLAARIDALPAVAERDDAFARFARFALARSSANS